MIVSSKNFCRLRNVPGKALLWLFGDYRVTIWTKTIANLVKIFLSCKRLVQLYIINSNSGHFKSNTENCLEEHVLPRCDVI